MVKGQLQAEGRSCGAAAGPEPYVPFGKPGTTTVTRRVGVRVAEPNDRFPYRTLAAPSIRDSQIGSTTPWSISTLGQIE